VHISLPTCDFRYHQTNLFSRQQADENLSTNIRELAGNEMPATTGEIMQIEDEEALSQAIETFFRVGRLRKATQKAKESAEQSKSLNIAQKSNWGDRGER
jgi:hypothetical protein